MGQSARRGICRDGLFLRVRLLALAAFQLPLYGLADEGKPVLAIPQDGGDPIFHPGRKAEVHMLWPKQLSSHAGLAIAGLILSQIAPFRVPDIDFYHVPAKKESGYTKSPRGGHDLFPHMRWMR